MNLLVIWIVVCAIIPLYSYNKILGIVIKKTNFKNEKLQQVPDEHSKLATQHLFELKARETNPVIIKEYKRLILMLWLPLLIMAIGFVAMFVFGLIDLPQN